MPRRYSANVTFWMYQYLVERDTEKCAICAKIPATQNGLVNGHRLEVDHIDGNPHNNDPSNLRLLCKNCNIAIRNHILPHSPNNVCVRRRIEAEGNPATRIVRQTVDYTKGGAEMQTNFLCEVDFRRALIARVQAEGWVNKADAITAGAEERGCSPATAARYVSKLVSSAGPLKEEKDMLGGTSLVMKPALTQEEPGPAPHHPQDEPQHAQQALL